MNLCSKWEIKKYITNIFWDDFPLNVQFSSRSLNQQFVCFVFEEEYASMYLGAKGTIIDVIINDWMVLQTHKAQMIDTI